LYLGILGKDYGMWKLSCCEVRDIRGAVGVVFELQTYHNNTSIACKHKIIFHFNTKLKGTKQNLN